MKQITNCDFADVWAENWEREIRMDYSPEPEKEIDYSFIDRVFKKLEEMMSEGE